MMSRDINHKKFNLSDLNEWRRLEMMRIKEENRQLRKMLDEQTLELLALRTAYNGKDNSKQISNKSKNNKNTVKSTFGHAGLNALVFPVVLPENAKIFSRLLYPTKKLAYYYALLGVKNTFMIVASQIKHKIHMRRKSN
jgi:hypothetical protein